ncbi:MAG: hypothetical protein AABX16_00265, partial [Nanoarchaeota archaeon]
LKRLHELKSCAEYCIVPRQRSYLYFLEETIIARYFKNNLDLWNSYLEKLKDQYGAVNPISVSFYIQELGFWDNIEKLIFKKTSSIQPTPHEVLKKRIEKRKKLERG